MPHTNETTLDRLLPPSEARLALGCGTTKLYELIADGSLAAVKLGRHTRIRESVIVAFQDSLPRAAITTGQTAAAAAN